VNVVDEAEDAVDEREARNAVVEYAVVEYAVVGNAEPVKRGRGRPPKPTQSNFTEPPKRRRGRPSLKPVAVQWEQPAQSPVRPRRNIKARAVKPQPIGRGRKASKALHY
jgi:hypothetical protein